MPHHSHEIPVTTATIHPEDGEPLLLEYTLLKQTGPEGEILYALRADKRAQAGYLLEREETPGLTGSLDDAIHMAKAFAAGTVPPCVLLEMAAEWLHPLSHTMRRSGALT